jgi:hypothetical protein
VLHDSEEDAPGEYGHAKQRGDIVTPRGVLLMDITKQEQFD